MKDYGIWIKTEDAKEPTVYTTEGSLSREDLELHEIINMIDYLIKDLPQEQLNALLSFFSHLYYVEED